MNTFHRRLLPSPLRLLVALACAAVPAAQAAIDTRFEGLPSGLTVLAEAELAVCTANGVSYRSLGSQPLAEQGISTWEVVTLPFGGTTLVQRLRTVYTGQLEVAPVSSPSNCSFGNAVRFNAVIVGESGGQPRVRSTTLQSTTSIGTTTRLHSTLEARTASLTALVAVNGLNQAVVPTAITRGQMQQWNTSHQDSMGASSVVEPTLDFMVPSNFPLPGSMTSLARISIASDGKVCVRAGNTSVCRTRAQGGTVVNGNIEVDVADTEHRVSGGLATTGWRFRLGAGFPAGTVTARVAADDKDPIDYLVDGVATTLNLLPWKSFSLPVLVN